MKFQNKISRTVKVALFLLTVMLSCIVLQYYFLRNTDSNSLRVEGFYQEQHDSLDVVFIGASDIYTSFMPGRAYEKYGFTSYVLASESITSEGVKTAVKEAVRTQHPGMIVVEANAFLYGNSNNDANQAYIHKFFDNLPLTVNKLDYILNQVPVDQRWEYIFPLIKYHGLWTEFPERIYMTANNLWLDVRGFNYFKGFTTTAKVFKPTVKSKNDELPFEDGMLDLDPKLEAQLIDLLEYCQNNNVKIMFVRAPHFVIDKTYDRVKRSNTMAMIVNEYGFPYYSAEMEAVEPELNIDENKDFYNEDHMNVYGALKFTDYLSERIVNYEELEIDPLTKDQRDTWKEIASSTNKLYRYCDDLMKKGEVRSVQEDVITLSELGNYSGDPIKTK